MSGHSHSLWCIFGCPNKKPKPRPVQKPRGSGWTATGNPRQFPQGQPNGGRKK